METTQPTQDSQLYPFTVTVVEVFVNDRYQNLSVNNRKTKSDGHRLGTRLY